MSAAAAVWPFDSLGVMLSHPFVQYAFLAATPLALAAGLIGYFVVLRNQVFVSDALSHVAFTGALGAYALAVDPLVGLFGGTIAVALILGLLGQRARANDVAIGTVFAWVLGLGVLFLSLYTTAHSASTGNVAIKVLFGSVYGVDRGHALVALALAGAVVIGTLIAFRPLLFSSVDPDVAAARGLPVRAISLFFITLVAVIVAESVQVVGALLIIGLIVTPAAAALRLSARPAVALVLSPAIAVASVWAGLTLSYFVREVPPSFAIVGLAFAVFAIAVIATSRKPAFAS